MFPSIAKPVYLRATVLTVRPHVEGRPYRYEVQSESGRIRDIVSEQPIDCAVGDDLRVVGYRDPKGDNTDLYIPADGAAMGARLTAMLGHKVSVRSFGFGVALHRRPFMQATLMTGLINYGLLRMKPGATVLEHPSESSSRVIRRAEGEIAALGLDKPVVLVDAAGVLPGVFGTMGQDYNLTEALPARLVEMTQLNGKDVAPKALARGPRVIAGVDAQGPVVILPFSPTETSAAEFARITGLEPTIAAPKAAVPAEIRQTFNLFAALAEAAEPDALKRTPFRIHAFAALATARVLGNRPGVAEGLETLADWHDLAGRKPNGLSSGDAIRNALAAVKAGRGPAIAVADEAPIRADLRLALEIGHDSHARHDATAAQRALAKAIHDTPSMADEALRGATAKALAADVADTVRAGGGGGRLARAVVDAEVERLKGGVNVTVIPAGMGGYAHTEVLQSYAGAGWQAMQDLRDEALSAKGALNTPDPARKPLSIIKRA